MSSHHIVRDEQEPALFVIDPEMVDFEIISELLEWNPVLCVGEKSLDFIANKGVKIDVAFCSGETLAFIEEKLTSQEPVRVVAIDTDFIPAVIHYLSEKGHKTVSLIMQPQTCHDFYPVEIIFYHQNQKTYYLQNQLWRKWLAKGTQLFFDYDKNMEVKNLIFKGNNVFETVSDGIVEILHPEGGFWLSEEIK